MNAKPRVLITGASGFLAGYVAERYSGGKFYLAGLSRSGSGNTRQKFDQLYHDVETLITNETGFDLVFHLAAFIPPTNAQEADKELIRTNVELTSRLVESYRKARFIFASSVSVYGDPLQSRLDKESSFNKPGSYGLSKIEGERIVRNHPDHAIIRFSSIIGRHMKPHTFIPRVIEQSRSGTILLWGSGSRKQNYIDVRDAATLMVKCANHKGNILTLGVGERSYSNTEAAELVAAKMNSKIKYQGEDKSPSFEFDAHDTYQALGFSPEFSLEQSISHLTEEVNA